MSTTEIIEKELSFQIMAAVKATGLPLAIVINFGTGRVQSARLVNNIYYDFFGSFAAEKIIKHLFWKFR